jgi:hypothetical protein
MSVYAQFYVKNQVIDAVINQWRSIFTILI